MVSNDQLDHYFQLKIPIIFLMLALRNQKIELFKLFIESFNLND